MNKTIYFCFTVWLVCCWISRHSSQWSDLIFFFPREIFWNDLNVCLWACTFPLQGAELRVVFLSSCQLFLQLLVCGFLCVRKNSDEIFKRAGSCMSREGRYSAGDPSSFTGSIHDFCFLHSFDFCTFRCYFYGKIHIM